MNITKYFKFKWHKTKKTLNTNDYDWQKFKKLSDDARYYRIPLAPLAIVQDRCTSRENLYYQAQICKMDLDTMYRHSFITFSGQIDPDLDTKEFKLDNGNYLFVKVSSIEEGKRLCEVLISHYKRCEYNRRALRRYLAVLSNLRKEKKNTKTTNCNELHKCLTSILFR